LPVVVVNPAQVRAFAQAQYRSTPWPQPGSGRF
jgi:hypothetical protein